MSAAAKFLPGKVEESLTELVQPAGLVPAALLVLLNLAFIFLALETAWTGFAAALSASGNSRLTAATR